MKRWHEVYFEKPVCGRLYCGFAVHMTCSHGMDKVLWFVNFLVGMN